MCVTVSYWDRFHDIFLVQQCVIDAQDNPVKQRAVQRFGHGVSGRDCLIGGIEGDAYREEIFNKLKNLYPFEIYSSGKDLKTSLYLHTGTENDFHGGTSCFQFNTISSEEYRELRERVWSHAAPTNTHSSTATVVIHAASNRDVASKLHILWPGPRFKHSVQFFFFSFWYNLLIPHTGKLFILCSWLIKDMHIQHSSGQQLGMLGGPSAALCDPEQVCRRGNGCTGEHQCRNDRLQRCPCAWRLPQSDCRRGSACRWRSLFSSWSVLPPAAPLWPERTHRRFSSDIRRQAAEQSHMAADKDVTFSRSESVARTSGGPTSKPSSRPVDLLL